MTMKKKLLTTLSVVLILGLAALGILAYLTDTDSDVNTMTLGNVSIEQNEYQRVQNDDGTYPTATKDNQDSYVLKDFDQDKPLLPIVGDPSLPSTDPGYAGWDDTTVRMSQVGSYGGMQVFAGKNAQDKFVVVKNTGNTDAYVRTLVAIEVGSTDGSLIGTSYHTTWTKKDPIYGVEIAGNNYNVYEYVYKGADGVRHEGGILPAGKTAYPNLSQVYIKSVATNEDMVALDGNGNGTLDILVLSQAVQADGFDDATTALTAGFGEANAVNVATWFTGETVIKVTPENVQTVLNEVGNNMTIQLTDGDYGVLTLATTVDGATTTVDSTTGKLSRSIDGLTIKGADGVKVGGIKVAPSGVGNTISLNNIVIDGVTFTGAQEGFLCNDGGATIKNFTMKNCTMTDNDANRNDMVCIKSGTPESITITGCTVEGGLRLLAMTPSKDVTVTNNTISNVIHHGILLDNSGARIHSGTILIDNNYCYGAQDRFIRFANMDDAHVIITNNRVHQYKGGLNKTPYEDDYIKVTYKNDPATPNVTIYGNEANCATGEGFPTRGDLYISVNDERYVQP